MQGLVRRRIAAIALASALASAAGCDDASTTQTETATSSGGMAGGEPDAGDGANELARRGERIYNVNCIACHHRDPTLDGGLGPPVAGSSRELLEARVMRSEYPPGYTPRADTRLMIPLPHLEPELDALAAFLESYED